VLLDRAHRRRRYVVGRGPLSFLTHPHRLQRLGERNRHGSDVTKKQPRRCLLLDGRYRYAGDHWLQIAHRDDTHTPDAAHQISSVVLLTPIRWAPDK
jgi:hypothetical protein